MKIKLTKQEVEVVKCDDCGHTMVNLDVDQLSPGDLQTLKKEGIRISNPETEKEICINCEYKSFGRKLSDWFESEDDDDSSFFSSGGVFGGSDSFGGFGGGFGGFGGGSFGGGGVSRGF
jgi:hypothetical protein